MKMLSGAVIPDEGDIVVAGVAANIARPADAMALGIRTVYQELSLLPHLSVAENLLLGRMPKHLGFVVDWPAANALAQSVLAGFGFETINPRTLVSELSVAQQQIVEIAKALVADPRILILDEPTAVLSASETDKLFAQVRALAASGTTVLYISHRLEEIFEIADHVVVLKDGQSVMSGPIGALTQDSLIEAMVGRPLEAIFPPRNRTPRDAVLDVAGLSSSAAGAPKLPSRSLAHCPPRAGRSASMASPSGSARRKTRCATALPSSPKIAKAMA
jgi:ABC-type sugar transport system ATPase subunit